LFYMTILPPCNPNQKMDMLPMDEDMLPMDEDMLPLPAASTVDEPTSLVGWLTHKWQSKRQLNYGYGIDLCPSGHTCLMACSVFHMSPMLDPLPAFGLFLSALLVSSWIAITRCHYSMDIPWAWILSRCIYTEAYPLIQSWMS
jgi:hypothetical protein